MHVRHCIFLVSVVPKCEANFVKQMEVLKVWYCEHKIMGNGESQFVIPPLLNYWQLDVEHGLCIKINSKVAMKPPFDLNPLTCICKTINASWVLTHSLKYFKLAMMVIVHVLGSVEDERYF